MYPCECVCKNVGFSSIILQIKTVRKNELGKLPPATLTVTLRFFVIFISNKKYIKIFINYMKYIILINNVKYIKIFKDKMKYIIFINYVKYIKINIR